MLLLHCKGLYGKHGASLDSRRCHYAHTGMLEFKLKAKQ